MRKQLVSLAVGSLICASPAASAMEVSVRGFLNAGVAMQDAEKVAVGQLVPGATGSPSYRTYAQKPIYDGSIGGTPDFDHGTLVALQFDSTMTDDLSATVQVVAPASNDYKPHFAWGFLKYNTSDSTYLRFGRIRYPAFVMSEYLQVGYAHPWVKPPAEVYNQVPSGLANLSGADFTWNGELFDQNLSVSAFVGGASPEVEISGSAVELLTRNAYGANVVFGNEEFSVRAGWASGHFGFSPLPSAVGILRAVASQADTLTVAALSQLDNTGGVASAAGTYTLTTGPAGVKRHDYGKIAREWDWDNKSGSFWGLGYNLDWNNFYSVGEFGRRQLTGWVTSSYGYYLTLGYRMGNFLPAITFGRYRPTDPHKQQQAVDFSTFVKNGGIAASSYTGFGGGAALAAGIQRALETADGTAAQNLYQYLVDSLYDFYNNPQDTWTLSVRWDALPGTAVKASWENVRLKANQYGRAKGFFDIEAGKNGRKSANVYSLAINTVF